MRRYLIVAVMVNLAVMTFLTVYALRGVGPQSCRVRCCSAARIVATVPSLFALGKR